MSLELTPEQETELREALAQAFNRGELERLVHDWLDADLDRVVKPGDLDDVIGELVGWAKRKGRTERLIGAATAVAPRNPKLRSFCERSAPFTLLGDSLSGAFDLPGLRQLVEGLGKRLADSSQAHQMPRFIFELTATAEAEGWTGDLLGAACKARPEYPDLLAFQKKYATLYAARAARAGLFAMAGQAGDPQIRPRLDPFERHFQKARGSIKVLAAYKALHVGLHALQFQYYERIVPEAEHFPANDAAVELEDYAIDLVAFPPRLRRQAETVPTRALEEEWVGRLDKGVGLLKRALGPPRDPAPLRESINYFKLLLRLQPMRINHEIVKAAGELPLQELIDAMDTVPQGGLPDGRLAAGLQGLRELRPQLEGLVDQHNRWQQIDNEMRLGASDAAHSPQDVAFLWKETIRPALLNLCGAGNDSWMEELRKYAEGLDEALDAASPDDIGRAFSRVRRWAGNRFFEVDENLHQLCDRLLAIGEPLEAITRAIANANP